MAATSAASESTNGAAETTTAVRAMSNCGQIHPQMLYFSVGIDT